VTTDTEVVPQTGADPRPRADVLRLADGVELMGQAKGSGYRKPPHLVRRADGQVVQLTKLLYAVAALSDGRRDARAVAEILTHASNRRFAADDVLMLVDKRLRPVGVLARADGTSPTLPKRQA
jgi:putative peptide zinc metalloprotease protein